MYTKDLASSDQPSAAETYDVVIVGAGFAGLYALHRMRGLGLSSRVLEQGGEIGGTWYWNRYPGARCDVESLQYSYSFSDEIQQAWHWTERFASQPEILRYVNFVADQLDLRRDIDVNTRVVSADYDEGRGRWTLTSEAGRRLDAQFLIFATGALSAPLDPDIPALGRFKGPIYRTSCWPHEPVDFAGRRVAIVGTGSSGIQAAPVIAEQAEHLYVLQRTPNYAVPAYNAPMEPDQEREWKANYPDRRRDALKLHNFNLLNPGTEPGKPLSREEREREFEARWKVGGLGFIYIYTDMTRDPEVNRHASEFVRRKIAEKVADPSVAAKLLPTDYGLGGRRLCVDNGYYETFNRENVTLVDLRTEPLETMTENGFKTSQGDYQIDDLVLATGFDALSGALLRIAIRGRGGQTLRDKWSKGPANYLGVFVAGFPNMFMIAGPGSPAVLTNMVIFIEQHIDWVTDCIGDLLEARQRVIEAKADHEQAWCRHLGEVAAPTLINKTKSWYTGANVEGKKNQFLLYMGGAVNYMRELRAAGRGAGYAGFNLEGTAASRVRPTGT